MTEPLPFSVVVCSDARVSHLRVTLESLRFLSYDNFEVCVVCGPTEDGTFEYVARRGGGLKFARCDRRNLSIARNIGIAMSAGDIVAFLDDDAIPEPEWLQQLAQSYENPDVAAAGGPVYDETGLTFQTRFVTVDRLGYPNALWSEPAPHLNFAYSPEFPHLLGANCSFRRRVLLELGGFDEEYEYFLDETDLCCRVNDAGHLIDQRRDAYVHHKFAASSLRDARRIVSNWLPLLKNRIYFAMRNGRRHHSMQEVARAGLDDIDGWGVAVRESVANGNQCPEDLERFHHQAEAALAGGLAAAREPERKLLTTETLAAHSALFVPFATSLLPRERLVICLVTQDYPPRQNGGIARHISQLARSLASAGHHAHVFTRARGSPRVDFEDGVWVHRVEIRNQPAPPRSLVAPFVCPGHIWDYSLTMLREVEAVDARRRVDFVYCPLWDCEPVAFVVEQKFQLVCALQTTMRFWLESQPHRARDRDWMGALGLPIIAMEELIIARASLLHANSHAIVADIERKYGIAIPRERMFVCPLGAEDWAALESAFPTQRDDGRVRLLFVGRLETRKGIDVLLEAAPEVLRKYPAAMLDIVGDDTIARADGKTYKEAFLERAPDDELDRIRFHGRVEEAELMRFYRDCDVFVAPSRYESFGLIYLEAMMFGKPTIGSHAGGVPEVIADGVTGLLVEPGDRESLRQAMERLVIDRDLRAAMGRAGRAAYETRFSDLSMRDAMLAAITRALQLRRGGIADAPCIASSHAGLSPA